MESSRRTSFCKNMVRIILGAHHENNHAQLPRRNQAFGHGERAMLTINQSLALERVIVKHLIETLVAHGWHVDHVWNGAEEVHNIGLGAQLDSIFAVDESQIIFEDQQGHQHWVAITLGNGADVVSDFDVAHYDADKFGKAMAAFVESSIGVTA
jgi:hypothetical protein